MCKFVDIDVDKMDQDVVEALNNLVTAKQIVVSAKKKFDSGRCKVKATAACVEILWSADYWGYEYSDAYVRMGIEQLLRAEPTSSGTKKEETQETKG